MKRLLLPLTLLITLSIYVVSCGDDSSPTGPENGTEQQVQTYSVSVDITPSDGGTVSPSLEEFYEDGKNIQLLASPSDAYVFAGWTGDMEGSVNPLPLTVSRDFNITANFKLKNYDLTVHTEGEGSVKENVLEQKSKQYEHGTAIELVATPAQGYRFAEWKGDVAGTENPAQITVDNPKEVTAVFERKSYPLTVEINGDGAVWEDVVQAKTTDYKYGAVVELTASPANGWYFSEWKGALSGDRNPNRITVEDTTNVTAVFERESHNLDVETDGNGSISMDPDENEHLHGESVELTAEADEGWEFVEWKGDLRGSENPATLTMDEDKEVTALFEANTYTLTVNIEGQGEVNRTPYAAEYEHGTAVMLTAKGQSDYRLYRWEGDVTSEKTQVELIITDDMDVSVIFKRPFYLHENSITVLCPIAEIGESGTVNGVEYTKRTRDMITTSNASTTCTSGIEDMSLLFSNETTFNENISHWDMSSVKNMGAMFNQAEAFNQDIGDWDVSSVTRMVQLFEGATSFNQDIGGWDVSSVNNMAQMFFMAESFNQDIGDWDVSQVEQMQYMFTEAKAFNQFIGGWDVSNVTLMNSMFSAAESFNQNIGGWDISNVSSMGGMFQGATSFNRNIGNWNVSSVENMDYMFRDTNSFNRDLTGWCVQHISDEPTDFAGGSAILDENNKPIWGTCP